MQIAFIHTVQMDMWTSGLKKNGRYYEGCVEDAEKVISDHNKATVTCFGTRRSSKTGVEQQLKENANPETSKV